MKAAKLMITAAAAAVFGGEIHAQALRAPAGGLAGAATSAPSAVLNGVTPPPPLGLGLGPGAQLPGSANTIWSRLGISQEQREFCRRKTCRTPAGQLAGRLIGPLSTLTGGVIPSFCPTVPSVAELLDPGAIGAASKVKLDRAGAEERIKAVKYLATVDCHYWPEAEEALIGALRGDRNECVRYEAAVALSQGCCCTCKVIVALSHTVSCSDKDGFPSEKSARVRAVAAHALDRCMSVTCCAACELPCLPGEPVEKAEEKEKPKDDEKPKDEAKPKDDAKPMEQPKSLEPGDGGKKEAKPDEKKDKKDDDKKSLKLGDPEYPKQYYTAVARMPRTQVGAFGQRALQIGAQIGYTIGNEVNPRDYAAAGLPSVREGQSNGAKPTTIMELIGWKDSGAAIGQPLITPPVSSVATNAYPAVSYPTNATSVPMATISTPAPLPLAQSISRPADSTVPVVALPSAQNAVSKPVGQPLVVPTIKTAVPASTTISSPPSPAKLANPMSLPVPVTVTMPAAKPVAPAPVTAVPPTVKPQPIPAPVIAVPTVKLPAVALPKIEVPTIPPAPIPSPTITIPVPTLNSAVPTKIEERMIPTFAPVEKLNLKPVSAEVPVERISIPNFSEPSGQANWTPSPRKLAPEPTSIPTPVR